MYDCRLHAARSLSLRSGEVNNNSQFANPGFASPEPNNSRTLGLNQQIVLQAEATLAAATATPKWLTLGSLMTPRFCIGRLQSPAATVLPLSRSVNDNPLFVRDARACQLFRRPTNSMIIRVSSGNRGLGY